MHRKQHFLYFKYIDHPNIKIIFLFLVSLTSAPGTLVSICQRENPITNLVESKVKLRVGII
jgi:hypothetical protein